MRAHLAYRRLIGVGIFLGIVFFMLGYRLVDLQVFRHEELSYQAELNSLRQVIREPKRGHIMDVNGRPLALTEKARRIIADPTLITNPYVGDRRGEVALAIAPFLQMEPSRLVDLLQLRARAVGRGQTNYYQYVVLKRKVPLATWEKVNQALSNLDFGLDEKKLKPIARYHYAALRTGAVRGEEDQIRVYPYQTLASHVLGYVGDDNGAGRDGIEAEFNAKLSGVQGLLLTEKDKRGRELVAFREHDVAPRDGLNVVLTLDSRIQYIVENELAEAFRKHTPISISSVVVRPQTGEILAMATLPNFNPNSYSKFSPEQMRNRVIADTAEAGSTFKTVVIAAALNDHVVDLATVFDCEHGRWRVGYRTLTDDHSLGSLSVEEILMHSSNIGAAKIGLRMGRSRVYQYVHDFGFGRRTGIALPGEVPGRVYPLDRWRPDSVLSIPMGYELTVTPLQMVMAVSAIGNRGRLMSPMLVKRLEDDQGNVVVPYRPAMVRQVVSETAARQITTAMKRVVSKDGTGREAIMAHHVAAGKTGTAKKVVGGAYSSERHFSSFIGFFPADNPAVCVSVVIDEPKNGYYGGRTAAPIFKRIAEQIAVYLNIPPDETEEPVQTETLAAKTPAPSSEAGGTERAYQR